MVYHSESHSLVVYGGILADAARFSKLSDRLFIFNLEQLHWAELLYPRGTLPDLHIPLERAFHGAVLMGSYMVVFGGYTHKHNREEICYDSGKRYRIVLVNNYTFNTKCFFFFTNRIVLLSFGMPHLGQSSRIRPRERRNGSRSTVSEGRVQFRHRCQGRKYFLDFRWLSWLRLRRHVSLCRSLGDGRESKRPA